MRHLFLSCAAALVLLHTTACQDDFVYNTNNDSDGSNNAADMGDAGDNNTTAPGEMGTSCSNNTTGPGMCPTERPTRCGERCVDILTDATACGGCDTSCASGEVCARGQCTEQAGCRQDGCSGLTWCDDTDGQCKPGCAEDAQCGDNEVCDTGAHECVCDAGFVSCDGTCTQENADHCGQMCASCPMDANGTAACQQSQCTLSCDNGYAFCDSTCTACPDGPDIMATGCDGDGACVVTQCAAGTYVCGDRCCEAATVGAIESLDDVGSNNAIAVDSKGQPHIAFYDATRQDLKYARWDGSQWSVTTVDSVGAFGGACDLTLDAQDQPHIAYTDATNRNVKYARLNQNAWQTQIVGPFDKSFIRHLALAMDSTDTPAIVYATLQDVGGFDELSLQYLTRTSTGWANETIYLARVSGFYTEPAADLDYTSQDVPVVSYLDDSSNLIIGRRTGNGAWSSMTVESRWPVDDVSPPSLALDAQDHEHIAYRKRGGDGDLYYAAWDGSTWGREEAQASNLLVGRNPSLALNAQGAPHIVQGVSSPSLWTYRFTRKTGGAWQSADISRQFDRQFFPASQLAHDAAFDARGNLHLSYYDVETQYLMYARWDGTRWLK